MGVGVDGEPSNQTPYERYGSPTPDSWHVKSDWKTLFSNLSYAE